MMSENNDINRAECTKEKIRTLLHQIEVEFSENQNLRRSLLDIHQKSARYVSEYKKIITSKRVKDYLNLRKSFGKQFPYLPESILKKYPQNLPKKSKYVNLLDENCEQFTDLIPQSNKKNHAKRLRVGFIGDEFNYKYLSNALDIVYLNFDNFEEEIKNGNLDFVLCISFWRGLQSFDKLTSVYAYDYSHVWGLQFAELVLAYASLHGIKAIFQSIEDPPSYDRYLGIAKQADYIFTSDEACISRYKKDTGNPNVEVLEFGANPVIHNPIGLLRNYRDETDAIATDNLVLFAGSWYPKFKERCADTRTIFDGVLETDHDLIIFDRNYNNPVYAYPVKYWACLCPSVSYESLINLHKLTPWSINLNSVTASRTMYARRVSELQAMGVLQLSNYSASVASYYPNVFNILLKEDISAIFNGYTQRELLNIRLEGIRNIMSNHTVEDKLNHMFNFADIKFRFIQDLLYVVYPDSIADELDSFKKQSKKDFVLVCESEAMDKLSNLAAGYVVYCEHAPSNYYYLEDLYNVFKYADVAYSYYVNNDDWRSAYDYEYDTCPPRDAMFDLSKLSYKELASSELKGFVGFSVLEPVWGRSTINSIREVAVIIPVYNTGQQLFSRCFRSLLRSSIFNNMSIYLMDCGSTDGKTQELISELVHDYNNVESFILDSSENPTVFDARYKGVEVSTEPYIVFLSTDDEARGDGLALLLSAIKENNTEFATAPILVPQNGRMIEPLKHPVGVISHPKEHMRDENFQPICGVSTIFKRDLLTQKEIIFSQGAFSEDDLFAYSVMMQAKSGYAISSPATVRYQQNDLRFSSESLVKCFENSKVRHLQMIEFLRKNDLIHSYLVSRLPYEEECLSASLAGSVSLVDYAECAVQIVKIIEMYKEGINEEQ